jgi:hypothetical protein
MIRIVICVLGIYGRARTDKYTGTYVFENDYAALKLDAPRFSNDEGGKGLLVAEGESGVCLVICFSPRHDLTLAKMSVEEICAVAEVWSEQYVEPCPYLSARMRVARPISRRDSQRSLRSLAGNRHIGRRRMRFCYAPTLRWKRRWASDW